MQVYEAKVADILRCSQRDAAFVNEVQDNMQTILKLIGAKYYPRIRRAVSAIASAWYYYVTSLSNLQTLGEEYSGLLRVGHNNKIPPKLIQTLWLVLYVGGEPLLIKILASCKNRISKSQSLTEEAKIVLLRSIDVLKGETHTINRIHHAFFYINGTYYNISNRLTGIKYVLVRKWLQDDTFAGSFRLLGNISLFYMLFTIVQQFWLSKSLGHSSAAQTEKPYSINFNKICVLCAENLHNASTTPCGHIFCWECIYDSLNYQKHCPICREIVSPSRIIFLQNYL